MVLNLKTSIAILFCNFIGFFGANQPVGQPNQAGGGIQPLPLRVADNEFAPEAIRRQAQEITPYGLNPFGYQQVNPNRLPLSICSRYKLFCCFCFGRSRTSLCNHVARETNSKYKEIVKTHGAVEFQKDKLGALLTQAPEKIRYLLNIEPEPLAGEVYPGKLALNTAGDRYEFSVSKSGKASNPILGTIELQTERPFSFVSNGRLHRIMSTEECLPSNLFDLLERDDVLIGIVGTEFIGQEVVKLIIALRILQLSDSPNSEEWTNSIPFEIKKNLEKIARYWEDRPEIEGDSKNTLQQEKAEPLMEPRKAKALMELELEYILGKLEHPEISEYLKNKKLGDQEGLERAFNKLIHQKMSEEQLTKENVRLKIMEEMTLQIVIDIEQNQNTVIPNGDFIGNPIPNETEEELRARILKKLLDMTKREKLEEACFNEWIDYYLPLEVSEDLSLLSRFIYWLIVAKKNNLKYDSKFFTVDARQAILQRAGNMGGNMAPGNNVANPIAMQQNNLARLGNTYRRRIKTPGIDLSVNKLCSILFKIINKPLQNGETLNEGATGGSSSSSGV